MSKLPDDTAVGCVELTVRDLERSVDFYESTVGLALTGRDGDEARLGAGGETLLVLRGDAGASDRPRRSTGLFHLAILVPSRRELARSLARLAERRWPLTGASDHLVSEALYLADPDGIGIEIYRDRGREEWPHDDGEVRMATLPLDLESLAAELPAGADGGPVAPATRIGHVHLNVADLDDSERFWCDLVGFDPTVRTYPGALFVSAGGYHHHLGLNTWNGPGAPPPPDGAVGLRSFSILATPDAVAAAGDRATSAGVDLAKTDGGWTARDPAAIAVQMRRR